MRLLRAFSVAVLVVACGGPAPYDLDDLVADLEAAGEQVDVGETRHWSLFRTGGTDLIVDGTEIRAYEYHDEASRIATSETISMANWSVNATPVEFIAPPHFWPRGRIIVLYLGDDPAIISSISDLLGPEVR